MGRGVADEPVLRVRQSRLENLPGRHYATAKIARAHTTAYAAVWQFQTAAHYIKEQIHFGSHQKRKKENGPFKNLCFLKNTFQQLNM